MTTYYTKCGIPFEKSGSAVTTGYHLREDEAGKIIDPMCAACPFPIEIKNGWGETATHKRWECRAGSEPPNHENSYQGADGKQVLHIHSLDHALMEGIIAYAKTLPGIQSASYNVDSLSDCRKTLAVYPELNKKGTAAKKELIEKFFPAQEAAPEPSVEPKDQDKDVCGDCSRYTPESRDIGNCEVLKGVVSAYRPACGDFDQAVLDDEEDLSSMDLEGRLDVLLAKGDAEDKANKTASGHACGSCSIGHSYSGKNTYVSVVQSDGITTVRRPIEPETHYCIDFYDGRKKIASDKDFQPDAAPDWCPRNQLEKQQPYKKLKPTVNETTESVIETTESVTGWVESVPDVIKPAEVGQAPAFDYSEVDEDTAHQLQDISNNISRIRLYAVHDIGKQLAAAHGKLAAYGTGTFGRWCESIGFSRDSAENYMRGYQFICRNFGNIDEAANIQPSLLFAASKPSAPPELAQAVIDGDITKHKDYVEAMRKLKKAEEALEAQQTIERDYRRRVEDVEREAELLQAAGRKSEQEALANARERDFEAKKAMENYQVIQKLNQQIDQLKRNTDPEKLKELGAVIREKQESIKRKESEIVELREQLSAKPIEVPAVEVKEIIPMSIKSSWYDAISALVATLAGQTVGDIENLVDVVNGIPAYEEEEFKDNVKDALKYLKALDAVLDKEEPTDEN